jgi:hypothetical protein
MSKWSVMYSYVRAMPDEITAANMDELCRIVQGIADQRLHYKPKLEFDDFTDELHVFFTARNGRRIRFANLQSEG